MTVPRSPLLAARGITKRFPGVTALDDVDFELRAGEVHALLGHNGAGKSTLIHVITGVHQVDEGRVEIDGVAAEFASPSDAHRAGIRVVTQERTLVPSMSVEENVTLGDAPKGRLGRVDWSGMRTSTIEIIERLGVSIDPREPVGRLRPSEQAIVEIARALSRRARILLLDEPTSSISEEETARLFRIIRELTAVGAGVIFVSHRVGDIMAIADRATVLRDGKVAFTGDVRGSRPDELIAAMIGGRHVDSVPVVTSREPGKVVMRANDLSVPSRLRDVSLEVHAGEDPWRLRACRIGAVDLPYALYGHLRGSGEVRIGDRVIASTADAFESGAAFVPAVRSEALLREETTARNIGLANLKAYTVRRIFLRARERRAARHWIDQLAIAPARASAGVATLSGGNQQKVDPRAMAGTRVR